MSLTPLTVEECQEMAEAMERRGPLLGNPETHSFDVRLCLATIADLRARLACTEAERAALKADIARHVCPHPLGTIRLLHQAYDTAPGVCWRCGAPAPWASGATCPGERKP